MEEKIAKTFTDHHRKIVFANKMKKAFLLKLLKTSKSGDASPNTKGDLNKNGTGHL